MRYYSVSVFGAPPDIFPVRYDGSGIWGTISGSTGIHDPNAQQVEFQIIPYDSSTPAENSVLTVYGVSWQQIQACNQLNGLPITVLGGMSPGLPLATFQAQRPKLILNGTILSCWGNWIGNETSIGFAFAPASMSSSGSVNGRVNGANITSVATQPQLTKYNRTGFRSIDRRPFSRSSSVSGVSSSGTIDPTALLQQLVGGTVVSDTSLGAGTMQFGNSFSSFFGGGNTFPLASPLNLIHNLQPNQPLSSAIQQTLSTAFPHANINVNISDMLKLAYQDAGMYQSLEQYAGYLNNLSQSIMGVNSNNNQGPNPGIRITSIGTSLDTWHPPYSLGDADINYLELVGQPTWIKPQTISVKVVLRGGLKPGMYITLPNTVVGFSGPEAMLPAGAPDQRTHVSLPGTYQITRLLHIGDLRNPDGASWTTNIEAISGGATGS